MTLNDIKTLIGRKQYLISSKVEDLIEDGYFSEADLEHCIFTATRVYKRERDELKQAVDGMKYVIIGRDTHGHLFYTAGKVVRSYTGRSYFFITAHHAE